MFGKLMSISDELMWRYFELLSFAENTVIEGHRKAVAEGANPRDIKFELAREIVARFHSPAAAKAAQDEFIARFRQGRMPQDMPEREIASGEPLPIANVLKAGGLVPSTSEALRMIRQGAVRIDGEKIEDAGLTIDPDSSHIFQVGKRRFARIRVRENLPS